MNIKLIKPIKTIKEIKKYIVLIKTMNYKIMEKDELFKIYKDNNFDDKQIIFDFNHSVDSMFDTLAEAEAYVAPLRKALQTIKEGKSGAFTLNVVGLSNLITAAFLEAVHRKIITQTEYVELYAKYAIESQTMNMGKMLNGVEIKQFSTTTATQLEAMFKGLIDKDDIFKTDKQIIGTIKEACLEFENIDKKADTPKELVRIIGKAFSQASDIKSHAQIKRLANAN